MKFNKTLTTLIAGAAFGLSGQVMAANERSEAGSTITNTAQLTFTVGNAPGNTAEDSVNLTVDKRIDITLTPNKSPFSYTVNPGDDETTNSQVVMTFKATNLTNADQEFKFIPTNITNNTGFTVDGGAAQTDTFDTSTLTVYTDNDSDYTNGGTTQQDVYTFNGDTLNNDIADADKEHYVHIVATIPNIQDTANFYDGGDGFDQSDFDNVFAGIKIVASATDGSGTVLTSDDRNVVNDNTVQVVFTEENNQVELVGAYQLSSAFLEVSKEVTALDNNLGFTTNEAHFLPGSTVRYDVTVTNTGSATASSVQFIDNIASTGALNLDPSTIANITLTDGATPTPTAIPTGDYTINNDGTNGNSIDIDLPDIAGSETVVISFEIDIR